MTPYGLDSSLVIEEPWSSLPEFLESVQWHFDATDNLLRQRIREMGTVLDEEQANYAGKNRGTATDRLEQQAKQGELKKQMASIADYTFSAYEERLTYLRRYATVCIISMSNSNYLSQSVRTRNMRVRQSLES